MIVPGVSNRIRAMRRQLYLHFKDQETSDEVTIDSLLGELGLLQVIKISKKGFPSIEIVKRNGREGKCESPYREAGLGLK